MKKIIRILPIIIGSMMLLYPWIGNWLYDHAVRSQAAGYEKALIEKPETELQNCILAAQNYNEELKKRQNVMIYPPQEQSLNHEAYEAVLCMNADSYISADLSWDIRACFATGSRASGRFFTSNWRSWYESSDFCTYRNECSTDV